MIDRYILVDGKPVPEPDLLKWAKWYGTTDRHVQDIWLFGVYVSTIFLGLDHSFGYGDPLLWETMIFGGPHDGYQDRYTSLESAIIGHQNAVEIAESVTVEEFWMWIWRLVKPNITEFYQDLISFWRGK